MIVGKGRSTVLNDMSRRAARAPIKKRTYKVAFGIEADADFGKSVLPYTRIKNAQLAAKVSTQFTGLQIAVA